MQNTLQALGAMEAEVTNPIPRLAVRIEIDGKFSEGAMKALEEFFGGVQKFENAYDDAVNHINEVNRNNFQ